ncbi:MAG: integrase arm-type DNA-binding domain-containing protein [Pseudomonadota bacterium]
MGALSAKQIENRKNLKVGLNADGGGLYLKLTPTGSLSWVYRYQINKRRRLHGLGAYPAVTLSAAREAAQQRAVMVRAGVDPIDAPEALSDARQRSTVADIVAAAFKARRGGFKSERAAGRWLMPLKNHVVPAIGHRYPADLTPRDLQRAFAPIWKTKAETARQGLNRLVICLRYAKAEGDAIGSLSELKADALTLLGDQERPETAAHIPAMPFADVPAFYQQLTKIDTVGALALRLAIVTGLRSGAVRPARTDWIDLKARTLTVPPEFMKGRKGKVAAYVCPLSVEALAVIDRAVSQAVGGYLFQGSGKRVPYISDMTMLKIMRDRPALCGDAKPHGFRASLKEWMQHGSHDQAIDYQLSERVLQHKVLTDVQQAYDRGDYLDDRRRVLDAWGAFLTMDPEAEIVARRERLLAELKKLDRRG